MKTMILLIIAYNLLIVVKGELKSMIIFARHGARGPYAFEYPF